MKKFILTIALVASASLAQAQLLWKVTVPESSKTSYILGTHHFAPAGMIDSISGLKDAITSVETVYGELDMSSMNDPALQQKMASIMVAPADSTLNVVLTKQQYDSVSVLVDKYFKGMASMAQLSVLKPAALATQLAALQNLAAIPNFNPADQLDTKVQTIAGAAGKDIKGFETIDFQLNLLYGDPLSEQAKSLMSAVRNDNRVQQLAQELIAAYSKGDLEKLIEITEDSEIGMDADSKEKLINERNASWAETLKTEIPEKSVLVAVGAGHLPGEKGLLALLKNLGFQVEPVK
ncbi:MAG: TraB/GumN family protein [Paramuribaculum sp.]|nr:TraB/GumN family protein [Paramuribaculum sp.]